ncbi:MAG TPA: dodecin [Paracoccaceae bacterium]|nr:dodecin [Paracoccaceae bacterium]
MADRTYKLVELVGTSKESVSDAIDGAIRSASASLDHVEWFDVDSIRGHVEEGGVAHYQVVVRVGFRVSD